MRLSKVLEVCPNHPEVDLTSIFDDNVLNVAARIIIAQIKLLEKEKAQEEILNNVSIHVTKENLDRNNLTIVGKEKDEYTLMKIEIVLLSQLNSELNDKNNILKQLIEEKNKTIEFLNQKQISPTKTYAQAIKKNEVKINHIPSVIVVPKTKENKLKVCKTVTDKLKSDIIFPIKRIQEKKDGTVKIKCASKNDVVKLEAQLTAQIGSDYMVKQEVMQNPRLKIVGIDNNLTAEELELDIRERNFKNSDFYCSVEHTYVNNKTKKQSAIISVPADVYRSIRENNSKMYVRHQCLRVFDDLYIMPCFKCGRIGHSGKKFTNAAVCLRCAGNHQTKDCDGISQNKCTNCCFDKEKFKDDRDVNHIATDTEKCTYLKVMINKKITNTDYPIKPITQRYLGFNGNIDNHTKVIKETTNQQNIEPMDNIPAETKISTKADDG